MRTKTSIRPLALGSVAVVSWSTVATAFKIALTHSTVFEMLFVASATTLLIFSVWMTVSGSWGELRRLTPRTYSRFAVLGLVMPVAYYTVLFMTYDYLPAQVAQPINYTWPILLAFLLALFGHKPIPAAKYAGMAVSLAGVTMISLGGKGVEGFLSPFGLLLGFCSSMLWALYWILNDSLKSQASQGTSIFLTFLFGMAYLSVASIFMPIGDIGVETLLSGAYIGAFEMGIPFICFGMALRETENPALINQMCYLAPFLSLFIISTVLGEKILPSTYIGLTLIVGGLIYNEFFAARHTPVSQFTRERPD